MATGTFTPTISVTVPPDVTERYITYYGTLAVSAAGDDYHTGGSVCSFQGKVPQSGPPVWVEITSRGASSGGLSNVYTYVPGTTAANGKVMILTTNGGATGIQALQELTADTAYNAATNSVNLDYIYFKATWRKGQ